MMLSITNYSVQFSHSVVSNSLQPHGLQHSRPPCPSPTPWVYSNSCPLSQWCHPTISSSVIPFSSCLQSFPESGSFQMIQLFASGGQSIRVSASALEKCKSKPQWGTTSQQSEWPSSKSLQIINDGEGTWRRGPSRTVCGNVNQCSQLGNSGGSLKN